MDQKLIEAVKVLLETDDTFAVVSVGYDDGHLWEPFSMLDNAEAGLLDDFLYRWVAEEDEHELGVTVYLYRLQRMYWPPYGPGDGAYEYEVSERIVLKHEVLTASEQAGGAAHGD